MAFLQITILVGFITVFIYYLYVAIANLLFARQHGCRPPRKRHTSDPILGLYYRIQDSRSAKEFRSLPAGLELHREYGETFCESTLFNTVLKTSNTDNIGVIFGSKANAFGVEPFRLPGMRGFCGEGLLTTDGPTWERSRSMIKPSFHRTNIAGMDAFKKSFHEMISRIAKDGSTIDLQPLLSLLLADTSSQFLLGHPIGALDPTAVADAPVDGQAFLKAWQLSLRSCGIRIYLGLFKFIMSKSESVDQWKIVHKLLDYHIDRTCNGQSPDFQGSGRSLLHNLIQQNADKTEMRNQIIQGMMAAQDTTAILISNSIYLLSRHPHIWRRLRDEVATVDLAKIRVEDFRKLDLLRNTLYEALRLFPVFPNLARVALRNVTLPTGGGVHGDHPVFVPKGSTVIANLYALHRNQEVFGEDIETFNPDRWVDIRPNTWQFMAFGGGQRACLGQLKALGEASYAVAKLAQTFERVESRDSREWAGEQKLTAKNANGCKVAFILG